MITAIAIDDEPLALEIIRSHAQKVPFLELKQTFTDAFIAMEYLQQNNIDLIFLDIKMPDISGIDFLKSLSQKPLVVFTTAYSEYAVTSFDLDAVDYLLKPFSLARFIKSCNKACELFQSRNSNPVVKDYLFIKTGYEQVRVFFEEILYIEASGNYVTFNLKDKKLLCRSTITEQESLLPADRFIRVHRSFIVALDKINKVEKHQIFIQKNIIPVADPYFGKLSENIGN